MGQMDKEFTRIEGTGVYLSDKNEKVISTFYQGLPNGVTLTFLNNEEKEIKKTHPAAASPLPWS